MQEVVTRSDPAPVSKGLCVAEEFILDTLKPLKMCESHLIASYPTEPRWIPVDCESVICNCTVSFSHPYGPCPHPYLQELGTGRPFITCANGSCKQEDSKN